MHSYLTVLARMESSPRKAAAKMKRDGTLAKDGQVPEVLHRSPMPTPEKNRANKTSKHAEAEGN